MADRLGPDDQASAPATDAWELLGIAPTSERAAIRRAYARQIRSANPEDDAQAFQRLRLAYEWALGRAASADETWVHPAERSAAYARVATGSGRLAEALLRLERLADASAPEQDLLSAFHGVLQAPEMAHIDAQRDVELRVAELIVERAPASNPLVDAAAEAFGWEAREHELRVLTPIQDALGRRDDLAYLGYISRIKDWERRIFLLLRNPPESRAWRIKAALTPLASWVRRLLVIIELKHPTLEKDLNPASVMWWREYLAKPHFPTIAAYWAAAAGILMIPGIFLLAKATGHGTAWLIVGICAPLALLLPSLVKSYVLAPRRPFLAEYVYDWPPWFGLGWAPVSVLLVAAAAYLPARTPIVIAEWLAALLVIPWAIVSARRLPDSDGSQVLRFWQQSFFHFALVVWLIATNKLLDQDRAPAVAVMCALAVATFSCRQESLVRGWIVGMGSWPRIAVLASIALGCVAAAYCFFFAGSPGARGTGALLIALLSLTSILTASYLPPLLLHARLLLFYLGGIVLVFMGLGSPASAMDIGAGALILAALVPAAGGLVAELGSVFGPAYPEPDWG